MIKERLAALVESGKIDEYAKCTLEDMANKVAAHLTQHHSKVQKEVTSIMSGKVLEYEAKTIRRQGIDEGRREGKLRTLFELVRDNLLSLKDAAVRANMPEAEFQAQMLATQ